MSVVHKLIYIKKDITLCHVLEILKLNPANQNKSKTNKMKYIIALIRAVRDILKK